MTRTATPEQRGRRWAADCARLDAYLLCLLGRESLTAQQAKRLRRLLTPVLRPEIEEQP